MWAVNWPHALYLAISPGFCHAVHGICSSRVHQESSGSPEWCGRQSAMCLRWVRGNRSQVLCYTSFTRGELLATDTECGDLTEGEMGRSSWLTMQNILHENQQNCHDSASYRLWTESTGIFCTTTGKAALTHIATNLLLLRHWRQGVEGKQLNIFSESGKKRRVLWCEEAWRLLTISALCVCVVKVILVDRESFINESDEIWEGRSVC